MSIWCNLEGLSPNRAWPPRTTEPLRRWDQDNGRISDGHALKDCPAPPVSGRRWPKNGNLLKQTNYVLFWLFFLGGGFGTCQGVDCTFRWKALIGNDNLLTEGICPPNTPTPLHPQGRAVCLPVLQQYPEGDWQIEAAVSALQLRAVPA